MRLFNKGKHLSAESPRSSPNSTPYRSKAPSVVSNRSTEKLSNSTDSVSGSGGVVELTDRLESFQNWLCGAEEDAYKKENCVAIGWDSQRLHKLLECNKVCTVQWRYYRFASGGQEIRSIFGSSSFPEICCFFPSSLSEYQERSSSGIRSTLADFCSTWRRGANIWRGLGANAPLVSLFVTPVGM